MSPGDANPASSFAPPTTKDMLGRMRRLMVKELREILRDRRTIITLVLMPLLLYPLLGLAFRQFFLSSVSTTPLFYALGVASEGEAQFLSDYLLNVLARPRLSKNAAPETPTPFRFMSGDKLDQALQNRVIDLMVHVKSMPPMPPTPERDLRVDVETRYVPQFTLSVQALAEFEKRLALANQVFLRERLRAAQPQIRQSAIPVQVQPMPLEVKKDSVTLAALIPVILILMTITGAVYPAIDLTAGERERGTLEVLMAAPIPRLGLLFAKYVAVLAVALLTALVNLIVMTVTLLASGLGPLLFGEAGLSLLLALKVLGLLLLFAGFFSAALLTLASFARSFKEAQAYLIPLTLMSLGPGLLGIVPGIKLTPALAVTPVINMALLSRDLFEGQVAPEMAAVAIATTCMYALAALALAARVFGAEAVLYSEQSGWSDLFRRPAEARSVPAVSSALLCLALLLPGHVLFTGLLISRNLPVEVLFLVRGLETVMLVAGLPMLAAWAGHVRLSAGLQLRRPAWRDWFAAVLFGVSLWPFLYALGRALHAAGLFQLNPQIEEAVQESVQRAREVPLVLFLLALAVIPAICEELLFRGYLFSALKPHGPAAAIFGSAVLFGVFHTFMAEVLGLGSSCRRPCSASSWKLAVLAHRRRVPWHAGTRSITQLPECVGVLPAGAREANLVFGITIATDPRGLQCGGGGTLGGYMPADAWPCATESAARMDLLRRNRRRKIRRNERIADDVRTLHRLGYARSCCSG